MEITKVYIDASNLKFGVEQSGWKLDYERFYKWLNKKFKTDDIFIFFGFVSENQRIYEKLKSYGYKIVFRPTLIGRDGKIKGNVDGDLILAVIVDYFENDLDKVVIVSGDGDYYSVVNFLISKKVCVIVIAPNKNYLSLLLKRTGGSIIILNELKERLSLK